jgi:hypothetical protein
VVEKIGEVSDAVRLLAWHVDQLSKNEEVSAEPREVRNAMQKAQEATPLPGRRVSSMQGRESSGGESRYPRPPPVSVVPPRSDHPRMLVRSSALPC